MAVREETTGRHLDFSSAKTRRPKLKPYPKSIRDTGRFSDCLDEAGEAPSDLQPDDVPHLLNALDGYVKRTSERSQKVLNNGVRRLKRISNSGFQLLEAAEDEEDDG